MARTESTKITTLTSLRFVAAMMIVFHHLQGSFGIGRFPVTLSQGVSFFFVLSGFIMATVYPKLEGTRNIFDFYRKRFARIWPGYIAATILGFVLIKYEVHFSTLIPYLLMIQGWIPITDYFFAYNALAWSVSTEVFFYLLFPLISDNIDRNIFIKLAISGFIVLVAIFTVTFYNIPTYTNALGKPGIINSAGILYIGPTVRIFEFIFGMMIAVIHRKVSLPASKATATFLEIACVLIATGSLFACATFVLILQKTSVFYHLGTWIANSGSVHIFGLMVLVFAQQRGKLSAILQHRVFVFLGEISFSIYLVHQILLIAFVKNYKAFSIQVNYLAILGYLILVIFIALLFWRFIEKPGRSLLSGKNKPKQGLVI